MTIESPKYSFVKFDGPEQINTCCDGLTSFCIPIVEETDNIFQLKIKSESIDEIQEIWDTETNQFQLVIVRGVDNSNATVPANVLFNITNEYDLSFEQYRTGVREITLLWRQPLKDFKNYIKCGECFQLAIVRPTEENDGEGVQGEFTDEVSEEFAVDEAAPIDYSSYEILAISNCFKRHCNDCYLNILQYSNDDNYGDFNYCNITNPLNRVRLPFYLSQGKPLEENAVYRRSNGVITLTKSLLTKEYLVQLDYLPEHIHDKIALALAHDYKNVETSHYSGGISKNGEYAIEWIDQMCNAQATFKSTASPFAIRNNNCQSCKSVTLPGSCIIVLVDVTVEIVEAHPGEGYSYHATWDVEDGLVNIGVPEYSLDGGATWVAVDNYALDDDKNGAAYGIDIGQSTDLSHSIRFIPYCDDLNFGETSVGVYETDEECVAVGISGTPNLPNAIVGEPYSYSIPLTGTPPFSLASGMTKPAWMTIAIVGINAQLTGTPPSAAEGVTVAFIAKNCTTDTIAFSDTFTVLNEAPGTPGGVSLDCDRYIISPEGITFGVAGTYNFYNLAIDVITPGQITVTAHNDQSGSISGYSMYKSQTITVGPGQDSIDFQMDYDGFGVHALWDIVVTVTSTAGTETCNAGPYGFN